MVKNIINKSVKCWISANSDIRKNIKYYISAFSALTLLVGQQEGHPVCKKQSGGVLVWLSVWSKVQTCIWPSWCHCHSLSLASVKSRLVLAFWYRLTWVVPEKGPLNACVCIKYYNNNKNNSGKNCPLNISLIRRTKVRQYLKKTCTYPLCISLKHL